MLRNLLHLVVGTEPRKLLHNAVLGRRQEEMIPTMPNRQCHGPHLYDWLSSTKAAAQEDINITQMIEVRFDQSRKESRWTDDCFATFSVPGFTLAARLMFLYKA